MRMSGPWTGQVSRLPWILMEEGAELEEARKLCVDVSGAFPHRGYRRAFDVLYIAYLLAVDLDSVPPTSPADKPLPQPPT